MILSFKHKGIEKFYTSGSKAGIQPEHTRKLSIILAFLTRAKVPSDMAVDGWALHPLKGEMEGHWSVKVNGNWRVTFRFTGTDVEVVDYQDYH
jgi:proteic killer suppression protein